MRRKIPSSHALLCFEAAAQHCSFSRAAQALALTQSAVSRQITALEEYLGVALFERTRHGVALTPAGQQYAGKVAQRLLAIEQDTLEIMRGHSADDDVRLACVATFATQWLIPRLPLLRKKHPDMTVHIETRTRPFLFAESAFDAAIYAGTQEQVNQWAGTRHLLLQDEAVVAVCSPTLLGRRRTFSPQAIAQLPLIQQSTRPDAWPAWFEAMQVDAPLARVGPRYELFSMACAAAAHGLGVALVPRLLIATELARGELVLAHPAPLPSQRHYFLIYPDQADLPPSVQRFSEWLQSTPH
jgi:LysR family glycine cleavage system transcriptional activator